MSGGDTDKKTKVLIAGLVLLAVVFTVGIGVGIKKNDKSLKNADEYKRNDDPLAPKLQKLFNPSGPKLELPRDKFPVVDTFSFSVPPSKERLRMATFSLKEGIATIKYADNGFDGDRPLSRLQIIPLPRSQGADDRLKGTIVASEKGGQLRIDCEGGHCRVDLD